MKTLRSLYVAIPDKWKIWILSFLSAWLIRLVFGVEKLLGILIFTILISILLRNLNVKGSLITGKQAIGKLFGYFRGVIIFAFLPVVWESVHDLIRNRSLDSVVELVVVIIVILIIWKKFDEIIGEFIRQNLETRRRRRR